MMDLDYGLIIFNIHAQRVPVLQFQTVLSK